MDLFKQRRRHAVGSKAERMKLRGIFLGGLVGILSLAAMSTHPHAIKAAEAVHSSPLFPRTLISLPDKLFMATARSDAPHRRFLNEEEQIETCHEDHPDVCGDPANSTVGALAACLVDEEQEGACCIPEDKDGNAVTDFDDAAVCITNEDELCAPDELCVAELVPGSGKGAECFQEFEDNGGIPLYLFLLIYLFLGLAVVCDDYFSYALDMLGDLMGMSSDVKGATFAAIGSSAPELFVSLADNVIANPPKSVGVGTIVGSAIFNILVIIGASAVVAGRDHGDLQLNWRPLMRDSFFYVVSICALIGVAVTDDEAEHYEGAILLLFYLSYLLFMSRNQTIFNKIDAKFGFAPMPTIEEGGKEELPIAEVEIANVGPDEAKVDEDVRNLENEENKAETEDENDPKDFVRQTSGENTKSGFHVSSASRRNLKREANTMPRERRQSFGSAIGKGKLEEDDVKNEPYWSPLYWPMYDPNEELPEEADRVELPFASRAFGGGWKMWLSRTYYLLVFPINFCFRISIPDSRYDLFKEDKPGVKNHRPIAYWLEFIMSVVWIAILSHFLVFSAAKFGCLVGIPPSVMGLTVLAAGTSIPDMITSIILTKNGEGDAAVANSIGSNVFDILVGLGLPWFIAGFVYGGSAVATGDIGVAIGFLFGVLIVLIGALLITKFKLNSVIGYGLLVLYVLYVCFELFIRPAVL